MSFLLGVVIFIAAVLISIILHELGHFLTAKKFGMKVTQFFVGFGNTLWSTKRGETEYGVKSLPFGAFVRITGMTTFDEVASEDEARAMRNKPRWQRAIVMVAGSFMHFALAFFLLFILAIGIGTSTQSNTISGITSCVPASVSALNSGSPCPPSKTAKTSPARDVGLKPGDKIISLAGTRISNFTQLHNVLKSEQAGATVPIVVVRNGHQLTRTITLAHVPNRGVPYLGVEPTTTYQSKSFPSSIAFAGTQFADTITSSVSAIGKLPAAIPDLFAANRANTPAGNVSSVVGVGNVTGDVVEASIPWQAKVSLVLYLIASLNIFVGAFNLLPLLPLDGGHLAVVIFERIRAWFARLRNRPDPGLVDIQKLVPVSMLVFAALVGLGTLLIAADIFNPVHLQV